MEKRCDDICQDFKKHRPTGMIHEWKMMKCRWEIDPSQPDPYVVVEKGETNVCATSTTDSVSTALSFNSAKLKLVEIEAQESKSSHALPHKLSPSSFICMGLELEDQQ